MIEPWQDTPLTLPLETDRRQRHPQVLWVGVGCGQGIAKDLVHQAIQQIFQLYQLSEMAIAGLATIDRKAQEPGLIAVCADRRIPLHCFPATVLNTVPVTHPSQSVAAMVGTASVAEAAARWAATYPAGDLTTSQLRVPKQIVRSANLNAGVTIAVAERRPAHNRGVFKVSD